MTAKQLETKEEMERALPMIVDAMDVLGGTHELPDLIQLIMNGDLTLWISKKSFMLTEVVEYPRLKELNMFLVGGNLEELLEYDDPVTEYAIGQGCARIEGHARPGFGRNRTMRAIGFVPRQTVVSKEIRCHG
tara:strand:- start:1756 stop:2154 length:399 start_codon:yes stop_codon:yes gene_type:complete